MLKNAPVKHEKLLAYMSGKDKIVMTIIRKKARLAIYYNVNGMFSVIHIRNINLRI